MTGTFLTPTRRKIIRETYGRHAPAVEKFLCGFALPLGQHDPVLADLFANVEPLRQTTIDFFKRQGVPANALGCDADGEGIALAEAKVMIDGSRFDFSDHDEAAERVAVVVARSEEGQPVDLIAWQPRRGALATLNGRAAILGAHELRDAHFDEPLTVYQTMLGWLKAGRRGVVVLDASRAWRVLDGELLGAANVDHGLELRRMLQPPAPRIVVPNMREAA